MKKLLLTSWLIMLFLATSAQAHQGGHGAITVESAKAAAKAITVQFVKHDPDLGFGKLPSSWAELTDENILIHEQGKDYYIVALKNSVENKTFYVLMAVDGEVYDANFTGKFEGLKQ